MKSLLLSEIFPPKTGGSGRWFWEIYRRMPRQEITVLAGSDPNQDSFDATHDVNVRRIPLTLPHWGFCKLNGLCDYWKLFNTVRSVIRSEHIQRVHCGRSLPEGWIAWLLKRLCGVPYVCFVHGEDVEMAAGSRELAWMVRRVLRGADFVVANSANTAGILHDSWQLDEDHIRILHPGVDTQRFVPVARDKDVRNRLGWDDRTVILTVSRLQKRKGHDTMIRALSTIREAVPDVLYAIVGDGEEREELDRLVDAEGVQEHVQFLGELDDAAMTQCYQQCDLFVLPNRQVGRDIEGFGMVLLEAQACGRPVVAGASGGTAETMSIPETGHVVPCDGPDELAALVTQLLLDPERLREMGRNARTRVTSQFDWDALSREAAEAFGIESDIDRDTAARTQITEETPEEAILS
jgi:phosphatidyl-myo-inositol dimannoside synthase